MSKCPNCKRDCIPLWRAVLMPNSRPVFTCRCCGAKVQKISGWRDVAAFIPLIGASVFIYSGKHKTINDALFYYGLSVLIGLALWFPLIRYRTLSDDELNLYSAYGGTEKDQK